MCPQLAVQLVGDEERQSGKCDNKGVLRMTAEEESSKEALSFATLCHICTYLHRTPSAIFPFYFALLLEVLHARKVSVE